MNTNLTAQDLMQFETEIAELFNAGKIRSVVHLYSGGEDHMIDVFSLINPEDWVLCSWRSHYQCLLKGVPRDEVKAEILAGRSIALCFPEYRILSSGIVGGTVSIAVGIALGIKRTGGADHVHCFIGDMTSETGIAYESIKYAQNFDLPVTFHIEDNNLSCCTDTRNVWGTKDLLCENGGKNIEFSQYSMKKYPHSGAGKRVEF